MSELQSVFQFFLSFLFYIFLWATSTFLVSNDTFYWTSSAQITCLLIIYANHINIPKQKKDLRKSEGQCIRLKCSPHSMPQQLYTRNKSLSDCVCHSPGVCCWDRRKWSNSASPSHWMSRKRCLSDPMDNSLWHPHHLVWLLWWPGNDHVDIQYNSHYGQSHLRLRHRIVHFMFWLKSVLWFGSILF